MGSINKTVTSVAILKLVEAKRLSLDEPALPILAKASLVPGRLGDPRMDRITVRNLLTHSAGFDRSASGDPFFQPRLSKVSSRQGVAPVTCEAIIRDSLEQRLDFAPGERYAYSNVGYCILGKIIEIVAGEPYRSYVSQQILSPSIGKAFLSGRSLESMSGEARYYVHSGESLALPAPGFVSFLRVPAPYGSYSIESMDALGAWVATPADVLKFFLAIDGMRGNRLLSEESVRLMREPPALRSAKSSDQTRYYGLGVEVLKTTKGDNWWHGGSQPGLQTLALRTGEGFAWVIAFNSRPKEQDRPTFFREFDRALWAAARSVSAWPDKDIFDAR
jgi:N-acyl-D-amino-acid deacylase